MIRPPSEAVASIRSVVRVSSGTLAVSAGSAARGGSAASGVTLAVTLLALLAGAPLVTDSVEAQVKEVIGYQPGQPFSAAVRTGNTIYFSGRLGLSEEVRAMEPGAERDRLDLDVGEVLLSVRRYSPRRGRGRERREEERGDEGHAEPAGARADPRAPLRQAGGDARDRRPTPRSPRQSRAARPARDTPRCRRAPACACTGRSAARACPPGPRRGAASSSACCGRRSG